MWKTTKDLFGFLKYYYQQFYYYKRCSYSYFSLLKVFIWFDITHLYLIAGERWISNIRKKLKFIKSLSENDLEIPLTLF